MSFWNRNIDSSPSGGDEWGGESRDGMSGGSDFSSIPPPPSRELRNERIEESRNEFLQPFGEIDFISEMLYSDLSRVTIACIPNTDSFRCIGNQGILGASENVFAPKGRGTFYANE